jgi:hypothetical protein
MERIKGNMTSEEINKTIEFILQHQAQTSVHLEELAKHQTRHEHLFAQFAVQGKTISDLLEIQSRRLRKKQTKPLRNDTKN